MNPLRTPHPTSGHPPPSSDEGRGKGEGSRADSVHFLAFGQFVRRVRMSEIPKPSDEAPLRTVKPALMRLMWSNA